jgi:hypothetical protein
MHKKATFIKFYIIEELPGRLGCVRVSPDPSASAARRIRRLISVRCKSAKNIRATVMFKPNS